MCIDNKAEVRTLNFAEVNLLKSLVFVLTVGIIHFALLMNGDN